MEGDHVPKVIARENRSVARGHGSCQKNVSKSCENNSFLNCYRNNFPSIFPSAAKGCFCTPFSAVPTKTNGTNRDDINGLGGARCLGEIGTGHT